MLTLDQLQRAQSGDESAVREVWDDLAPHFPASQPERRQAALVGIWEALQTVELIPGQERRAVSYLLSYGRNQAAGTEGSGGHSSGISPRAIRRWERALGLAGGDPVLAERLASDPEAMGKGDTMSAQSARQVRHLYQVESLSAGATVEPTPLWGQSEPTPEAEPPSESERRAETVRRVRETLSKMGRNQRIVLAATFGIDPEPYYGTGRDEEIAEDYGIPYPAMARSRGKARFRALWEAAYGTPA